MDNKELDLQLLSQDNTILQSRSITSHNVNSCNGLLYERDWDYISGS